MTLAARYLLRRQPFVPFYNFSDGAWTLLNVTVAGFDLPPDGTRSDSGSVRAWQLEETSTTAAHGIIRTVTKTAAGQTWRGSAYYRATPGLIPRRACFALADASGANGIFFFFDPLTWASAVVTSGTGWTSVATTFKPVGSGWVQVILDVTTDTTASILNALLMAPASPDSASYLGVVGNGMAVFGPELGQIA